MGKEIIITDYSILEVEQLLNQIIDSKKTILPKTGRLIGKVKNDTFHASIYKTVYLSTGVLSQGRAAIFSVRGKFYEQDNQTRIEWFPDSKSHSQSFLIYPILLMPTLLIFLLEDFSWIFIVGILGIGFLFYLQYNMLRVQGENAQTNFKARLERRFKVKNN